MITILVMLVRYAISLGAWFRHAWLNWPVMILAFMYFYNLSLIVPFDRDNWDAPVRGVIAAGAYSLSTSYIAAWLESKDELR